MKTSNYIPAFLFLCGAALGILLYREFRKQSSNTSQPQQLTLEQILSIRELHLVKHTYTDLFFLHKKNDKRKAIRAIVQMPVTITAYLNLNEIELVRQGDSIRAVILPSAVLNEPVYHINNSVVRETRAFQVYAGKDLYPQISTYVGAIVKERMDTTRHRAETNRILIQAEAEAKEYVENILKLLGHNHIEVTFNDATKDAHANNYLRAAHKKSKIVGPHPVISAQVAAIPFGFLPIE